MLVFCRFFFVIFSIFSSVFAADYTTFEELRKNRGEIEETLLSMKAICEEGGALKFTKKERDLVKNLIELQELYPYPRKIERTPLKETHVEVFIKQLDVVPFERENVENALAETVPATAFHTPVKVGKSKFLHLRGISPSETPRRSKNIQRLWEGKNPIHVDLFNARETLKTEMHHVSQNYDDTVADMPTVLHKGRHGSLHRYKGKSRIDRPKFNRELRRARKATALKELIHWLNAL